MERWWTLAIVAAMGVAHHPTNGQTAASVGQRAPFRGGVDVVTVNVTVTDSSRHYVIDLERTAFLVLEDGRQQQLSFFQKSGLPVALALLLDTSASMEMNLALAQEAAIGFVRELGPADVASVIDFDSGVQIRQGFTADRPAIERAIRQTAAGGSTSLYNAVYIALRELGKTIRDESPTELRRRAIVLLSDGEDTSSLVGFDEVLDLAARSDTRFTRWIRRPAHTCTRGSQEGQFVLRRLTQQTGGRAFFPTDAKELAGIYAEIKAELSSQYTLAYESTNPRRDGQFRRIAVRVERTGAVARARPGYYAPSK